MTANSIGTGVSVERELSKQLKVSLGTAFRYARIQDLNEPEETFGLLSFPARWTGTSPTTGSARPAAAPCWSPPPPTPT